VYQFVKPYSGVPMAIVRASPENWLSGMNQPAGKGQESHDKGQELHDILSRQQVPQKQTERRE